MNEDQRPWFFAPKSAAECGYIGASYDNQPVTLRGGGAASITDGIRIRAPQGRLASDKRPVYASRVRKLVLVIQRVA